MNPQHHHQLPQPDLPIPPLPALRIQPSSSSSSSSPSLFPATPTAGAQRRIAIAVDLSDESAYAVNWAVNNYLRPGDAVILLHVRPTSVLYGADWGSIRNEHNTPQSLSHDDQLKLEDEFDNLTESKANSLALPLLEANMPFKIHIVKDHDMKERLCLEVERLGLSAVIMGSRGFGASRRSSKGRLGSVSDYCVQHCICPVVVVRCPGPAKEDGGNEGSVKSEVELLPVQEEEEEQEEFHDASESDHEQKDA